MAYFSRLTDIVTCNLTKLIDEAEDRAAAIAQIIREMEDGLAGARRSMQTAQNNEDRLAGELSEQSLQVSYWADKAREQLKGGDENQARVSLVRKREAESLVAGLQQQQQAAVSTREHLATTFRALEARLADAKRRQIDMSGSASLATMAEPVAESLVREIAHDIEDELAALKRELEQDS